MTIPKRAGENKNFLRACRADNRGKRRDLAGLCRRRSGDSVGEVGEAQRAAHRACDLVACVEQKRDGYGRNQTIDPE